MPENSKSLSIILPAKNEARSLTTLVPILRNLHPEAEIIIVNDGSYDETAASYQASDIRLVSHPYSMGNGAAIKTGARHARGDILVFMDADGQHRPEDIPKLLAKLEEGYDMVVGARDGEGQASMHRWAANSFYNKLASWMTNQKVADLTSGFRAVRADKFREFLHLLPNGFSYPTTITMSFFRAGYSVAYVPIKVEKRVGKSHINLWRDGVRFLLIIFKVGTLYSPLKLFLPISLLHFLLGLGYYAYTFFTEGRFTNMSALLLTTAVLVFLIGLVSEQITTLIYQTRGDEHKHK
ncbi:MAG: glycosyltransferase family 2 protein [Pseudomonadota bacterium]